MKELELQTIERWVVNPFSQASENLASQSHESKRIPDPYAFLVENGKLKTLNGINIERVVLRGSPVFEAEYQALVKIQNWAGANSEGTSLWFSPPYEGGYPCLKIVASEIITGIAGKKILFNRALLLDVDAGTGVKIANYLSDDVYLDPEELRNKPIFLKKNAKWQDLIGIYTDKVGMITNSSDIAIKQKTLTEASIIYSSHSENVAGNIAREKGLMGRFAGSCDIIVGRSAFGVFFGSTFFDGSPDSFPCPRCNGPIPSGFGIETCPHCGLTKKEAGSTCG